MDADDTPDRTNPDTTAQNEGLSYYRDMAKEPFEQAGLRHRNISYLWVSAKGLDATEDKAKCDPQLLSASDDPLDLQIWEWTAEVLDYRIERGTKQVLDQFHRQSMVFGYGVGEINWQKDDFGRVFIADIWDRDPERFCYDVAKKAWFLKKSIYSIEDPKKLSPRKFLFHIPHLYMENMYGLSEFASLVKTAHQSHQVQLYCDRHLEKFGSGIMGGAYPDEWNTKTSVNREKRNAFLAQLVKMRNQGVFIHPKSADVKIYENQGAGELFVSYLQYLDDKKSIALTGNNMSIKNPSVGSYALAENTTAIAKSEYEQDDAAALCQTFNRAIRWQTDWMYWGIQRYPRLQLIDPRKIQPSQPEAKRSEPETHQEEREFIRLQTFEEPKKAEVPESAEQEQIEAPKKEKPVTWPEPHQPEIPAIFQEHDIQKQASSYLSAMPSMPRRQFDRLKPEDRRKTFTITELVEDGQTIGELQQMIAGTLKEPDELKAWIAYEKQARKLLQTKGIEWVEVPRLFISFRMARQRAYNEAIWQYIQRNQADLWGIRYHTQDDIYVRYNHDRMHKVTRPVNDPVWKRWRPLNGFGCRCWLEPITLTQWRLNPEQYQYTKELPIVYPDEGFEA